MGIGHAYQKRDEALKKIENERPKGILEHRDNYNQLKDQLEKCGESLHKAKDGSKKKLTLLQEVEDLCKKIVEEETFLKQNPSLKDT